MLEIQQHELNHGLCWRILKQVKKLIGFWCKKELLKKYYEMLNISLKAHSMVQEKNEHEKIRA